MTTYGFRLFTLEIFKGGGRKRIPFVEEKDGEPDWRYLEHLTDALPHARNDIRSGWPPNRDGRQRKDPYGGTAFELLGSRSNSRHIAGKFRFGRESGHEAAYPTESSPSRDPVDIAGMAAARSYRFFVLFPEAGDQAVVAIESVSGACPYKPLEQWFRFWSQSIAAPDNKPWYRARLRPLVDGDRLSEFLNGAEAEEAVLTFAVQGKSRRRETETITLRANLDMDGSRRAKKAAKDAVLELQTDDDLADSLAEILGKNIDGVGFDDAWVVMKSDDFGQRQFSPSRVPEVFTYVLGSERPDEVELQTRLKSQIGKLREHPAAATIQLDGWPIGVDDDGQT